MIITQFFSRDALKIRSTPLPIWLTFWLASLLLFNASSPLQAQSSPPGLTMRAQAAYDGHFKFGEWLPIWVDLQNEGGDLEAEVRVQLTNNGGPVVYAVPVSLPTGSRKRLPLYVLPNNFSREMEVQLVDMTSAADAPLLTAKATIEPLPNISYLVGLVAADRGALSFVSNAKLTQLERKVVLVDIPPHDLPARIEGLNSFDALIFNDVDAATLTPEQATVLQNWVGRGGRLILGGGAAINETLSNLPAALQTVSVQEISEVDGVAALATFAQSEPIAAPGPFTLAHLQADPAQVDFVETLAAVDDMPLLVEARFGKGYLDFVALDLAGAPFSAWTGTTAFWGKLLGSDAEYANWLPPDVSIRQMRADRVAYSLANLPSLDLPSIRSLSLLLLVYILLVGPGNYFLLRRLRKLHWAWATIPLLTILFSAGAFGLGYGLRGNDLILNKIAIIEPLPGGAANVTSFMGLFSPSQQAYEIEVDSSGLVSPMTQNIAPMGMNGNNASNELTIRQGMPARLSGLAINQWSMQSFMTESYVSDFGEIVGEFYLQGDQLSGRIQNQSPYQLSDVVVVAGAQFKPIGELAPGEEKQIAFGPDEWLLTNINSGLAWQIYSPDPAINPDADPSAMNSRAMNVKRDILSAMEDTSFNPQWQNGDTQSNLQEQNVRLIAWTTESSPSVRVAQREPVQQTTALLLTNFSLSLPESGPFMLPPGFLTAKIIERPFDGGDCGRNSVYAQNGQFVIEFDLPENMQGAVISKMQLGLRQDDTMAAPPQTELFDWQSENWVALENPVQGLNELTQTERLVSEDGRIQMRMTVQSFGSCNYINLGVSGER